MKLEEFRIKHSELIEHYQHIEFNLEGIFSALQEDKPFLTGMEEVEKDNISRLLIRIRKIQEETNKYVLTEADFEKIKGITECRNYWCHKCYIDMCFDYISGDPKKERDIKKLNKDFVEALQLRDYLFEKKDKLLDTSKNYRPRLFQN